MNYFKIRQIPFYYLYDTRGSELFNEITKLEEYYPFHKEEELLSKHAEEILQFKDDLVTESITLVEFGAGYSEKTEIIIKTLLEKYNKVTFVPIDVSESACQYSLEKYSEIHPNLHVEPFIGTYDDYLHSQICYKHRVIYLWLGSSIGNLEGYEQIEFLQKLSKNMSFRDFLLIGFDTVYKDKKIIYKAYNDSKGITAQFILNILTHLTNKYNLELNVQDFEYEGLWNEEMERMEMYLQVKIDTTIKDLSNLESILLSKGERILIEYSAKFSIEKLEKLSKLTNLININVWLTEDKYHMFGRFVKNTESLWSLTNRIFKEFVGYENLHERPIDLRNLFIFYLGHIYTFYDIKVFNLNLNERFFQLFERGRDPIVSDPDSCHRHSNTEVDYPSHQEILNYNEMIKTKIIEHIKLKGMTFNLLCTIEHEIMHQETLFYMLRMSNVNIPVTLPSNFTPIEKNKIRIPKRKIVTGSNETFVWDNESPQHEIEVDGFSVDNLPVTWNEMRDFLLMNINNPIFNKIVNLNEKFQIRISQKIWIDFDEAKHLPAWVNLEVANLYVEWKIKNGTKCRIMTENEYDSMISTINQLKKGNVNFKNFHAMPVGFYEDFSDDKVGELMGNGWELTSSIFRPFKGFIPIDIYSEYSQDFFTDVHYVLKGASPFTCDDICRKSFRNWYQYNYGYHCSKFRLVYDELNKS